MKTIKQLLTTIAVLLCSVMAHAHGFEEDGIVYNITSEEKLTVEVTYKGFNYYDYDEYKGTIEIPATVICNEQQYNVTSIGSDAFRNCYSLRSITIPNSVTSIGYCAFNGCRSLTSVTISESVTSIGGGAFEGCKSLTSITIPNSVTSIGGSAFKNCSSLTSVTIPNSVTSIGGSAFNNCSSLTSVTIPNSVTSIGKDAFYLTPFLNNQPDGCIYIGKCLYEYKGSMPENTHIEVKEGTTQIVDEAFQKCKSLTSITIPNSVTSIGEYAFENCSSLTSITIPESVTMIGYMAFADCDSLSSLNIIVKSIEDYCNRTNEKNGIHHSFFHTLGKHLIINDEEIKNVIIPEGVDSIGSYAFYGCPNLTSITIPKSVTSIGEDAFAYCDSLSTVIWNAKNCSVPYSKYSPSSIFTNFNRYYNKSITSFTFGDSVEYIPACLCYGMDNLTSITIPNNVTSIGILAFHGCSLKNVIWNAKKCRNFGVYEQYKGYYINEIFSDYSAASFTFGDNVEYIPSNFFYGIENLTSITVNATTPPTLGKNAFHNNLKYIYIPDNTISAYKGAWGTEYIYINNETSVNVHVETPGTLADEIVELGKRPIHILNLTVTGTLNDDDFKCIYETMTSLLTVDLYDITNTIGINFNGKSQLQKVVLPQCLTKIEERTFANCSALTSITIPSQVKSIGANAFIGCSKLDTITCLGLTPPEANNLGLDPKKCVLIVSSVAYKDYLKHAYWGQFLNIKTIDINYKNLSVVANNNEWGTIIGAGAYIENEKAILTATANDGYKFKEWSDGNTENPRIIVVTEDIELTAIFEGVNTPVENTFNNQIGIYSIDGTLHIEGLESDYQIYTTTGQFIYSGKQTTLTLPRGIYLIVINGKTHKIAL